MTASQLKEIRERAEKATAGSWEAAFYDGPIFIAHARQDIPDLLAHIDTLEARVKELEADGKRLDWLHKEIVQQHLAVQVDFETTKVLLKIPGGKLLSRGNTIRQAIDAAIKASEGDSK